MFNLSDVLLEYIGDNYIKSSLAYILLLVASVVMAPFTMPAFFIAGGVFGPVIAAVYNIIGWGIGAAIAFYTARFFKKPFLEQFVPLKKIAIYEKKIPKNFEFLSVVLLRMILPVDVLSYAIGFFSTMRFSRYMMATIIGITPFAFVFAYGGNALFGGNYLVSVSFITLAFIAFIVGYYSINNNK